MSGDGRIAIDGARAGGLEQEVAARLRALDLASVLLPPEATAGERHALLAKCNMLIALYPAGPDALLVIGLAAGMGLPVLVLAGTIAPDGLPRGVRTFATLQPLLDAVPAGPAGRHIGEALLRRLGACDEGVAWYLRRYPGGRRSGEWTPEEQVAAFADGGARWLKTAFDHGLIPHHAMSGADFAGADLAGLRLTGPDLSNARLAGARLHDADLVDADLRHADLSGADLTHAALLRADLRDARATGATMDAVRIDRSTLVGMQARGLSLVGARIAGSTLTRANLRDAKLSGASLREVDLRGSDLSGVDARGASFDRCHFGSGGLDGADFTGAVLHRCSFAGWTEGQPVPAGAHIQSPILFPASIGKTPAFN